MLFSEGLMTAQLLAQFKPQQPYLGFHHPLRHHKPRRLREHCKTQQTDFLRKTKIETERDKERYRERIIGVRLYVVFMKRFQHQGQTRGDHNAADPSCLTKIISAK
jgi:hypothetical protein